MKKRNDTVLIDVNESNVSETGFFCYMSKRKSPGYRRKLDWLKLRFAEGMKIKMLGQGQRGFIEYIPGEYAWRSVKANGFMMIHCLWVVGKSKGKGYGSLLLNACLKEAKKLGMKGVAAVTSQGNWLIGKKILQKHGFESIGQAPPSFELMVKPFGKGRLPSAAYRARRALWARPRLRPAMPGQPPRPNSPRPKFQTRPRRYIRCG